jgi:hypothetical protein
MGEGVATTAIHFSIGAGFDVSCTYESILCSVYISRCNLGSLHLVVTGLLVWLGSGLRKAASVEWSANRAAAV